MKILIILSFLFSLTAIAGTCSGISRTNANPNTILTSTKYNADLNSAYGFLNAFDGGCVSDNTVEKAALNTTDFKVPLNSIKEGCALTRADAATIAVDKCNVSVNNTWVSTTTTTNVTWGCSGCATETGSTNYYVYAKTTSTPTSLALKISTEIPDGVGQDSGGNKILGYFYNNSSSDIETGSIFNWRVSNFDRIPLVAYLKDAKTKNTGGGTFLSGAWKVRLLNTLTGDTSFISLTNGTLGTDGTADTFTLQAGTYRINCEAPAYVVGTHQTRLYNSTAGTVVSLGSSHQAGVGDSTTNFSTVKGIVTVTAPTNFQLQHYTTTGGSGVGFGIAANIDVEVYSQCEVEKLAR